MHRTLLLLIGGIITLSGRAQEAGPNPPTWSRWEGSEFSLEHPSDWNPDASAPAGTAVVFRSAIESGDRFQENLNVMVQDVGEMTLAEYANLTKEQVSTHLANGAVLASHTAHNAQGDHHSFEYTGELDGLPLHWMQIVWIRSGKAYLCTVTSHQEAWTATEPIAKRALASFVWLKK